MISQNKILEGIDFFDEYEIQIKIGQGNNNVYKVINKKTQQLFAMKEIIINNDITYKNVIQEVKILQYLQKFQHNHIVNFIDYSLQMKETEFSQHQTVYIVMELGGLNLQQKIEKLIEQRIHFPQNDILQIIYQLIDALLFLQEQGISHGDIKPENVIIMNENPIQIKVGDMGCGAFHDYKSNTLTIKGTVPFMAPELVTLIDDEDFKDLHSQYKSDVFSLGLLFVYILNYEKFQSSQRQQMLVEVQQQIIEYQIKKIQNLDMVSKIILNLIRDMLRWDFIKRPSFIEIYNFLEMNEPDEYFTKQFQKKKKQIKMVPLQLQSSYKQQSQILEQKSQIKIQLSGTRQGSLIKQTYYNKLPKLQSKPAIESQNVSINKPRKLYNYYYNNWKFIKKNQQFIRLNNLFKNTNIYQNDLILHFQDEINQNQINFLQKIQKQKKIIIIFDNNSINDNFQIEFINLISNILLNIDELYIQFLGKVQFDLHEILENCQNIKTLYLGSKHHLKLKKDFFQTFESLQQLYIDNIEIDIPQYLKKLQITGNQKCVFQNCDQLGEFQIQNFDINILKNINKNLLKLNLDISFNQDQQLLQTFNFVMSQIFLEELTLKFIKADYNLQIIQKFSQNIKQLINLQILDLTFKKVNREILLNLISISKYMNIKAIKLQYQWLLTYENMIKMINDNIGQKKPKIHIDLYTINYQTLCLNFEKITKNDKMEICHSIQNTILKIPNQKYICFQCQDRYQFNFQICESCKDIFHLNHKNLMKISKNYKICKQPKIQFKNYTLQNIQKIFEIFKQ